MKNKRKTNLVIYTTLFLLLVGIILSAGCLSEPMNKVADIVRPSSVKLFQNENYYQINSGELTVPSIPIQQIKHYDDRQGEISEEQPGFEISSYYYYNSFYQGSEGVISVYVNNMGDRPVHIYEFGITISFSEDPKITRETGITIDKGEDAMIGLISIDVPEKVEELYLRPHISLLTQTKSGSWHDYGEQQFEDITIEVSEKADTEEPEYIINPENVFNEVNSKIKPFDVNVRTMAAVSAKKYPGQYNIYQLCSLFDDTKENIQYISDPRGKDLWSKPGETLTVGAGDCDDYAILLASLVESIGGTSRVYLTDTHAFAAVYIGNNTEEMATAIGKYYDPVPIYYTTDEYGSWLLMDPTSSMYAGGLPGGTAPTSSGWTFINTTTVTVIDIAPQN